MSMFSKKNESSITPPNSMNQLGVGTVLIGDLKSDADIRIDGKIRGNVSTKGKLVIGSSGVIDGNVTCLNAYIQGRVNGKVTASELLVLSETAYVDGDISIKKLAIEDGAKFNGRCIMGAPTVVSMDTAAQNEQPMFRAATQH